jgi:hypothetical protein
MISLKSIPWLSLTLLMLIYGAFGWLYASWATKFIEQKAFFGLVLEKSIVTGLLQAFGVFWVLMVAIALTAPVTLMTFGFNNLLSSEFKAFMLIIVGSLAFALIIQWIVFFTRFFILLAAALLAKVDLQVAGCDRALSALILGLFALGGFAGGLTLFYEFG